MYQGNGVKMYTPKDLLEKLFGHRRNVKAPSVRGSRRGGVATGAVGIAFAMVSTLGASGCGNETEFKPTGPINTNPTFWLEESILYVQTDPNAIHVTTANGKCVALIKDNPQYPNFVADEDLYIYFDPRHNREVDKGKPREYEIPKGTIFRRNNNVPGPEITYAHCHPAGERPERLIIPGKPGYDLDHQLYMPWVR